MRSSRRLLAEQMFGCGRPSRAPSITGRAEVAHLHGEPRLQSARNGIRPSMRWKSGYLADRPALSATHRAIECLIDIRDNVVNVLDTD